MNIKRVKVENFKSLKNIDISLNSLTLITGINSSGKSSFIQSLLLFKQNQNRLYNDDGKNFLKINDEYVHLGNKKDILFQDADEDTIGIYLFNNNTQGKLLFNNKDLKIYTKDTFSLISKENSFNLFDDNFQYITTDRVAPNITYALSDEHIERNLIGFKGEFTAHYLAENRHKNLDIKPLKHPNSVTNHLLENVSLWLGEISKGIEISATVYNELQQVNLTYNYIYGENTTNKFTPLNVGFGITYVLPIIVALLKAKPGDLIIIENPESHLHPAAQSKIAELCAIASSSGVQIIVETHSDHFLNGIRVAIKKEIMKPDDSSIYYFSKNIDELETKIDELKIDKNGRINQEWPKGFFDEWDNKLDELLW